MYRDYAVLSQLWFIQITLFIETVKPGHVELQTRFPHGLSHILDITVIFILSNIMKLLNIVFYEDTHAEIYYNSEVYFRKEVFISWMIRLPFSKQV